MHTPTIMIGLATVAALGPATHALVLYDTVRWDVNGHYYSVLLAAEGVSWNTANASAQDFDGHLATITSQEENDFVAELVNDPALWSFSIRAWGPWIGLYQTGANGQEEWVTGEILEYTNWDSRGGEPSSSSERATHFFDFEPIAPGSTWNDWDEDVANSSRIISYVIETTEPIPAPSTTVLLGMAAIVSRRRRR
ncbi:MAG: lectin-like protein [Planctomycetota bacterium]